MTALGEAEKLPNIAEIPSMEGKAGAVVEEAYTNHDEAELAALGKKQQLRVGEDLRMKHPWIVRLSCNRGTSASSVFWAFLVY